MQLTNPLRITFDLDKYFQFKYDLDRSTTPHP